ncbi:hypothetical protein sscle_15g104350 [Sclerotinia sclerotiorum 1980 UF-70]|uniref:Protein kinase domain-containing protein n=1 Tax=Sclerotinia sclerotiorum (strain ATCC 18683 / 1980 / Ss-1) TaxID=665079 RepID=A0A1D9QL42_SCLS1|nr:hypothetical protein sscle_15g104350 [Sclerotinia sclerotiorum 1980 UF-70]
MAKVSSTPHPPPSPPSPPLLASSDYYSIKLDPDEIQGPLEFRMGQRLVTATTADRIDPQRTVYRLKIEKPSILDYIPVLFIQSILKSLFSLCPSIKTTYPEWFLPSIVIVKKRKPDWDNEFEVEKRMYRRLQPLQGRFIPYFYGEATYDGSPALVLSEIIGRRLYDLTMKHGEDDEFKRKLEEVYKALTTHGVTHEDPKLDNAIDVGDRVMIFDLEQCVIEKTNWEGSVNKGSVIYLLESLQSNRQYEDEARQREEERLKEKAEAKAERRRYSGKAHLSLI